MCPVASGASPIFVVVVAWREGVDESAAALRRRKHEAENVAARGGTRPLTGSGKGCFVMVMPPLSAPFPRVIPDGVAG